MKTVPTVSMISFFTLFNLFSAFPVMAEDAVTQPSVSRRVLICDKWQWIGESATTWGCLSTPRQVELAGGQITDQVILSLQDQISKLEAKLEKLNPLPLQIVSQ